MYLVRHIPTEIKKAKYPQNRFFAKIAPKTTSGSGFHFKFAFYALDLVENAYNIEGSPDTF